MCTQMQQSVQIQHRQSRFPSPPATLSILHSLTDDQVLRNQAATGQMPMDSPTNPQQQKVMMVLKCFFQCFHFSEMNILK